jgi:nucleoside-diphosphate-sugar epimerase
MQKIVGTSLQPVYAEGRQGDVKDSQADITKARTRLGYEPTVDLEEGLRRTLDWFRRDRAAGR